MIKTQTPEENKFLRRILPHYYKVRDRFELNDVLMKWVEQQLR